jgi:hypothetical protein
MQPSYLGIYRALVTSTIDPTNSGKIKVQCPQISGSVEIRAAEPADPVMPVPSVNTIVWIAFSGGDITKPLYFPNSSYVVPNLATGSLELASPTTSGAADPAELFLLSGAQAQSTGALGPYLSVKDGAGNSAVDIRMSGSLLKTNDTGSILTKQTPSYTSGWATMDNGGSFNGLQYRQDNFDNVTLIGAFHRSGSAISANTNTTLFTLVSPYVPKANWNFPVNHTSSSNVFTDIAQFRVATSGTVSITNTAAIATGDNFYCCITMPLGNIS